MARDTLVGQKVTDYTVLALIGEGGTSTVFRAEHPQHGVVALKVLREKLRHDTTAVARFLREAKYGTRVTHPNVVRTIEIGDAGGLHFLAIEWATGQILEKYARQRAPVPGEEVGEIIVQIASAVQAAHSAGIVHRDLKPDNVMYDPVTHQVKLLDFGIAFETDSNPEERLTRAGFFVGTLMYVAPEAISGALVTPQADQYSLATIAYYLLSGCHPYTARSPREMFTQLLSQPPIPLNKARPGLKFPAAVEAVIMRGLAKEPSQRYPNVLDFARALQASLDPANQVAEPEEKSGLLSRVKTMFRKADLT